MCSWWGWADEIAGMGGAQTAGAEAVVAVRKNQAGHRHPLDGPAVQLSLGERRGPLWGRGGTPGGGGGVALLEGAL